jgi:AcrR family transcriptional regulator
VTSGTAAPLDAWLAEIGESGWRRASVKAVSARAGMTPGELTRRFGGRIEAAAAFQDHVAADAVAGAQMAQGSVREKLFDGLMQGFDFLQARRAAALAIWNSRDPGVAMLLAGRGSFHLRRLSQSAGVEVHGVRGRLRLLVLSGLCVQAFQAWAKDESADMSATMATVDRLLGRAEDAEMNGPSPDLLGLPGLTSLLSRLPLPRLCANGDPAPRPSPGPRAG